MLTHQQLATIRGALRYWQEEMCPHGQTGMQHYLEPPDTEILTADEVNELRRQFAPDAIRYGLYDPELERAADERLFLTAEAAAQAVSGPTTVLTALLPIRSESSSASMDT